MTIVVGESSLQRSAVPPFSPAGPVLRSVAIPHLPTATAFSFSGRGRSCSLLFVLALRHEPTLTRLFGKLRRPNVLSAVRLQALLTLFLELRLALLEAIAVHGVQLLHEGRLLPLLWLRHNCTFRKVALEERGGMEGEANEACERTKGHRSGRVAGRIRDSCTTAVAEYVKCAARKSQRLLPLVRGHP